MSWLRHFPLSFHFPCSWSRDNVRWALKGGHRVEVRDSENPFQGTLSLWFIVCSLFILLVRIFMMKNSWSDAFVFSSHIPGIWGLSLAFCFGVLYSVCVLGGGYSQSFSLLAFPCLLCGLWAALVFLIFGCWDARQQKTHEFEEGKSSEPRSRSAQGHLGSSIMLTVQGNCSRRPQTTIRALWPYRSKPKSSPRPL